VRLALALLGCSAALLGCGSAGPEAPVVDASGIPRAGDGSEPRFGYNEDLVTGSVDLGRVASSGADTMRRLLSWQVVEPVPGQRDWSDPDGIYQQLVAQGTRPLWVLVGAPCWASALGDACDPAVAGQAPAVDRADELADFLAEAAERYPESLGFEVGNEQNLARFWRGGLHPADFAVLLGAAADAIHAVDPEMPVIAGGLAPVSRRAEGELPWRGYLRAIYAAGVDERIDAVAFHPYTELDPDQDFASATAGLIGQVRRLLRSLGGGRMPIWVTEVGLSTAGPYEVSPIRQARGLVRIYHRLRRRGVPVIIVHRFDDQTDSEYPAEAGYGVIRGDARTPKPAYCALARARGEPCRTASGERIVAP